MEKENKLKNKLINSKIYLSNKNELNLLVNKYTYILNFLFDTKFKSPVFGDYIFTGKSKYVYFPKTLQVDAEEYLFELQQRIKERFRKKFNKYYISTIVFIGDETKKIPEELGYYIDFVKILFNLDIVLNKEEIEDKIFIKIDINGGSNSIIIPLLDFLEDMKEVNLCYRYNYN